MYITLLKRSENYKAQPYQYASSSKQILRAKAKPFLPCIHCGFNDHIPDDCRNYPECEICGSTIHSTSDHNEFDHFKRGEKIQAAKAREPTKKERIHDISNFHVFGCPMFIHNHKDHLGKFDAKADDGYFLGYSFVSKAFRVYNIRRQQIKETYHVTFDESMEAIRWSRDQHIKLVNIIGDLGEGMLTRSMAPRLIAVSASECLFAYVISEIEPKRVFEALKHRGWIDAMQEELN
ncbi:retrovirus-related pol polyprotein from transposon TNT 1-94 [Tanacetum coccineum]